MEYRPLTSGEIDMLKYHGCSAANWGKVHVREPFNPNVIFEVHFLGEVFLGANRVPVNTHILQSPGLFHSVISDCRIGDQVRIADTKLIHGYAIGTGAIIERVNEISMTGESSFGNGQTLDVLNEGGGRELMIFDGLSSQIAYMTVLYRHDAALGESLKKLTAAHVNTVRSRTGTIGENAVIRNSSIIRNVNIGEGTRIDGAIRLEEGTIASSAEDPAIIGEGVVARHFIILHGTAVESSAMLDKVFAGQGVRLGKQFSAENSVFFANCEGYHGEAVSLFAGPYTVSHHKSTLLIAALTSFYNAGSGTNQSNHMYKLGPLHQGILDRGSKTGSFAYLLWPCHIGAFSVVMGKHSGNFDTSDFPFSYITLEEEKSFLTPGMNLITVGTRRDVEKWPSRDRRKTGHKLDLITFEWLNPMIVRQAVKASEILQDLYDKTPKEQESVSYKGVRIKRLLLKSCKRYYDMLAPIFLGEQVIKRIGNQKDLKPSEPAMDWNNAWIDVGGMVTPKAAIDRIAGEVSSGRIASLVALKDKLDALHASYEENCWNWSVSFAAHALGKQPDQLTAADFRKIILDWKDNKIKLNNMILADAKKEFDPSSRIGFGLDGDQLTRDADFDTVRGTYDGNKFVKGLLAENKTIDSKAEEVIAKLA